MRSTVRRAVVPALLCLSACGPGPTPDYRPDISEDDRGLGAEQHSRLLEQFGGAYAGPQARYVATVGDRVARAAGLGGQCTFTLVNTDVVNAFAVPGCYIYVTRGLLAVVGTEAQLASVLGHELGHVVGDHMGRQQERSIWRTLGVLAVSLTGSEQLTRLAGRAAEFFTLRYSRNQEYESDDLGIRYLVNAGYSPYAASEMLGRLGRQENYLAETGGEGSARAIPEWARSHPLTDNRVARAEREAERTGVARDALAEGARAYLGAIDGLLYGDDPQQGFVLGRRFAHPVIRIGFAAPPGFALTNSPQAITLSGPEGVRGEFGGGPIPAGGLEDYAQHLVRAVIGDARGAAGTARRLVVNGLPAIVVPARIETREGAAFLTVAVYDGGAGGGYHFILVAPPGADQGAAITALIGSFHRLSPAEVARLRPRAIDVVQVPAGTGVAALAPRMASGNGAALFRVLNGLDADAQPAAGQWVKLVRWQAR